MSGSKYKFNGPHFSIHLSAKLISGLSSLFFLFLDDDSLTTFFFFSFGGRSETFAPLFVAAFLDTGGAGGTSSESSVSNSSTKSSSDIFLRFLRSVEVETLDALVQTDLESKLKRE